MTDCFFIATEDHFSCGLARIRRQSSASSFNSRQRMLCSTDCCKTACRFRSGPEQPLSTACSAARQSRRVFSEWMRRLEQVVLEFEERRDGDTDIERNAV